MATKVRPTFTLRVDPLQQQLLVDLARLDGTTPSDLIREFISDGIHRKLDPAEVERKAARHRAELERVTQNAREKLAQAERDAAKG